LSNGTAGISAWKLQQEFEKEIDKLTN